ncbi:MAG: NAD-dependent epimerase/dehydratase family protein, partial [Gemmatimonadales bacterium]|nr:NAD-dependent epimerase/dehydratase family protein [Gemmatimonadales bacterium]
MRLLVTGAGGFVGGAVVRHARAQGIPVRAMLRPGGSPATTLGIESVEADLSSESELAGALRDCTAVIHLAAARTARGTRRSVYREVNVEGTRRLLRAAQEAGVSRFVFASTLGVHGFVTTGPIDESTPARPNTAYRESKWLAERLVAMPDDGRMTRTIARLATVVGAEGRNLDSFLETVSRDHLRLLGDGANRIDLIASEDAADGLVRCATMPA